MELPVIGGSGAATIESIARAVRKGEAELSRSIIPAEDFEGAVLFCDPDRRGVAEANCARDVHLPAGSDPTETLRNIDEWFSGRSSGCGMLVPTELTLAEPWRQPLRSSGYETRVESLLVMQLDTAPPLHPSGMQVVPARALPGEYRAFLRKWYSPGRAPEAATGLAGSDAGFLDVDALDVLVARHEGNIVGSVGALTVAEVGIVRALRTSPTAPPEALSVLLWHLVDLCKRSQFRTVAGVVADRDGWQRAALEQIGMSEVARMERYVRSGVEVCT